MAKRLVREFSRMVFIGWLLFFLPVAFFVVVGLASGHESALYAGVFAAVYLAVGVVLFRAAYPTADNLQTRAQE